MASQGPKSPNSATAQLVAPTWSNAAGAKTSDDDRASFNGNNQAKLRVYTFNFTIPSNATINGIHVEVEGYGDNTNRDIDVGLSKSGYTLYGNWKSDSLPGIKSSDEAYISFGNSSDLWGGSSWSFSDINSTNFGVLIRDQDLSAFNLFIDHVRVTVYYTKNPKSQVIIIS